MNKTLISKLRKQHGWTQEDLADRCRLSVRTVQRLESGEDVSTDTLRLVAEALNVKVGDLFESIHNQEKENNVMELNNEQVIQLRRRKAEGKLIKTISTSLFVFTMILTAYCITLFPDNNLLQTIATPIWLVMLPIGISAIKFLNIVWLGNKLDRKYPLTKGLDIHFSRKAKLRRNNVNNK